jgi:FHS family Na+ dependent glucose MFS transporter 1
VLPLPRADRLRLLSTAAYFASYALVGVLGGAVGPTLGPFAAQVGVGLSTIGILLTARSLGYLVGAAGSSRWVDRTRVHRGLAASALFVAAFLTVLPWARSLGLLVLFLVPLGFATASLDIGVSTMLLHIYRNRAAPFISALHFSYGAGGLAAPFLVAALAVGSAVLVYPILAVGFALLGVAFLALPESPAAPLEREEPKDVRLGRRFLASPRVVAPTQLGRGFLAATTVILVYVGAEIGFASWLYVFVDLQFGARSATAVTGAFWGAFTLFRLLGILGARRWPPERILTICFSSALAFALLLALSPHSLVAVWVGAVGVGASVAAIYPTTITVYSRRYELTGRHFGAIAVASCLGSMTFPWLIGRLLEIGGPVVVPAVTVALLAAASVAAWWFLGRRTNAEGQRVP